MSLFQRKAGHEGLPGPNRSSCMWPLPLLWRSSRSGPPLGREPGSSLAAGYAMLAYYAFILVVAHHLDKPTYFDWTVCGYFFVLVVCLALWPSATLSKASVLFAETCALQTIPAILIHSAPPHFWVSIKTRFG